MNTSKNSPWAKWKRYVQIEGKAVLKLGAKVHQYLIHTKKKYPKMVQIVGLGIRLILVIRNWK